MRRAPVVGMLALLGAFSVAAGAQDTSIVARHTLPLDTTRAKPWQRSYDMVVRTADSASFIGVRTIRLGRSTYAGAPAWLLVETRSGAVAALESLFVSQEMRPLHWSSALGVARLVLEFARDSLFGGTSGPAGKQTILLPGRPDLLASTAMLEALLPLMPLSALWADSANVLRVDHATSAVLPATLAVIGEDVVQPPAVGGTATAAASSERVGAPRDAWIVVLRAGAQSVLFWADKETGELLRMQQVLPLHLGSMLEYRRRPVVETSAAPDL